MGTLDYFKKVEICRLCNDIWRSVEADFNLLIIFIG